jgi:uncharacterized repeat protein (TIGR01451 family)
MPAPRSSPHDPSARGPDPGGGHSPRRRRVRAVLAAVFALTVLAIAAPSALAAPITGTAFEDFNDNGTRNNGDPAVDSGVGGITVTAYAPDGSQVAQTTTAADGTYTLDVPDGTEVRVEFTNLPAGYQPARHGPNSGTTVQYVTGPATGVDVGVLQPGNFCQDNPQLAVACMKFGGHTDAGLNANAASIRIVPDTTADDTFPTTDANQQVPGEVTGALFSQTGAVFGVAQPTASNHLYSAAFTKRHSDWGPGGPGAIYRTSLADASVGIPNASVFFDVNDLPGDPAGGFTRAAGPDPTGSGGWGNDADAWDQVGNSGLGNLSSSLDGSELYTVGLATRELIRIPIPANGSSPDPGAVDTYAIPNPCANPDDARPMGTGVKDGLVYVGGVCSMASVGDPPPQTPDDRLRVYVYTFDPATGAFSASPVLDTPLEADRLCIGRDDSGGGFPAENCAAADPGGATADWHPWTSETTQNLPTNQYSQPLLSDIEFVGDDLVLGIRDRHGDQKGCCGAVWPDGTTQPAPTGVQAGYNLRACLTGGAYQLESGGVCGGLTGAFPNTPKYGPGGGLFYDQTYTSSGPSHGAHDYVGLGGMLAIPGYPELRETATDAADDAPSSSAGVRYLNHADGSYAKGYNLYRAGMPGQPTAATFGKSNGLGDLEALCEAAPIEIGNYVWLDPDMDGIQDPGETRLDGVTVELLDAAGDVIATTTTDANGQYYFNEDNVPDGGIEPGTDYTVRIPLDQPVLAQYVPTNPDASEQLRDSDGITSGRYVIDRLTTGAAGHNDHTHDFGFHGPVPPPPPPPPVVEDYNVRIDKSISRERARVGDRVTYTLVGTNDGPATATDVTMTDDSLPNQVRARSVSSSQGECTLTGNDVACAIGTLTPGQSVTVTVRAVAVRTGRGVNTARINAPRDRDPSDNEDDAVIRVRKPDLGLTKGVNKKVLRAGETVTYTIRTRNPSKTTLRNVRTCDDLPAELVFVKATPKAKPSKGKYCWTEKRLAAGKSKTYKLTARAITGIRPGRKVNHATAKSPDAKTKRAKRAVRVLGAQVLPRFTG